jgi:hypothetical protein
LECLPAETNLQRKAHTHDDNDEHAACIGNDDDITARGFKMQGQGDEECGGWALMDEIRFSFAEESKRTYETLRIWTYFDGFDRAKAQE